MMLWQFLLIAGDLYRVLFHYVLVKFATCLCIVLYLMILSPGITLSEVPSCRRYSNSLK